MSYDHDNCPFCRHSLDAMKLGPRLYKESDLPYKCPVCDGRGLVQPPAGGYSAGVLSTADVTCNACKGAGVLWR